MLAILITITSLECGICQDYNVAYTCIYNVCDFLIHSPSAADSLGALTMVLDLATMGR